MANESLDESPVPGGTEGGPARGRRPGIVVLALVVVLAAAAWGIHRATASSGPEATACPGSTEKLDQKAQEVGLVLPKNARDLGYRSSDDAETSLLVSFSIGTADLRTWLAANHLPAPERDPRAPDLGGLACGNDLADGFADPLTSRRLLPGGGLLAVSIDMDGVPAAPSRPAVTAEVEAQALP